MEQNKGVKRLVNENVTRHDIPRHCEERSDEAIHSIDCRVGLRPPRNDEYRNGNPPTLTLPLRWGGNRDSNSGNSQSLINVKHSFTYSLIHLFTSRKRYAFTLAEVLITLGVIGVVAAMTIPTLINNYQEKVTVTKVKKMYSTLNQAIKLAEVDNGPVNTWNIPPCQNGGSQILYSYIKPYLKVAKECIEDNSGNCFNPNKTYLYLNGNVRSSVDNYGSSDYSRIILADGSLLWFRSSSTANGNAGQWCSSSSDGQYNNVCSVFFYDINGDNAPNSLGKDIFNYVLLPSGVYPHNQDDCYLNSSGWGCTEFIIENDNMDYPATKPVEE